jgi:hypothetical protein
VIDTKRVRGRCLRSFEHLDQVRSEIHSLAGQPTRQLGNWSLGQICQHLGISMAHCTAAEDLFFVPLYLRIVGPWIRRRVLTRGLPRGFQVPRSGAKLLPPPVSIDEGIATFESGLAALAATTRRARHPVFGAMNVDEWNQFHLRHAELHLSFIAPSEASQ